jgi:N-formylglutamate amidohydrolase
MGDACLAKLWMDSHAAFQLLNPEAGGPVVVSVPHAGRDYSGGWSAMLRPPPGRIAHLEDRHADALVRTLTQAPVQIARMPRAYIDLNRHEAEIDPGLVEGVVASRLILSPKVRSGLGVVPRRLTGVGELWRGRLAIAEVAERIETAHRPYHRSLSELLRQALDRCGVAVLLDLHSMPSLADGGAKVVIGNRYGQSAAPWATARTAAVCARFGLSWRENSPYAGGHVAERHGAPLRGVHAVQVEIDRSLYLDAALEQADGERLPRIRRFVAALVDELGAGAADSVLPLAAE